MCNYMHVHHLGMRDCLSLMMLLKASKEDYSNVVTVNFI